MPTSPIGSLPREHFSSAEAPLKQAAASPPTPLSPVFVAAGVRQLGDWLTQQSKRLPTKQQAMVSSLLAHLASTPAGTSIARDSGYFRFTFTHLDKMALGFALGHVNAGARNLEGRLAVNSGGEITGISIGDPSIEDGNKEVVSLERPSCQPLPPAAAMQKRLLEQYSGPPAKRQAASNAGERPLDTLYSNITLTPEAEKVLKQLENETGTTLSRPYYYNLRKELGSERNWRQGVIEVLDGFDDFLGGRRESLWDVMANFGAFAAAVMAYQREGSQTDRAKVLRASRIFQHLSDLSFGKLPLFHYVQSRCEDSASPLRRLVKLSWEQSHMDNKIHMLDKYAAAMGKCSVVELFQSPDKKTAAQNFTEVSGKIVEENSSNAGLTQFLSFLMVDAFDPLLGEAVLNAINDYSAKPNGQDKPLAESTTQTYMKIAVRLATYACAQNMSHDKFCELLEKADASPVSAEKHRKDIAGNIQKELISWAGCDPVHLSSTLHALTERLPKHLPKHLPMESSSPPQVGTAPEAAAQRPNPFHGWRMGGTDSFTENQR